MLRRRWVIFGLIVPAYTALMVLLSALGMALIFTEWPKEGLPDAMGYWGDLLEEEGFWLTVGTGWVIAVGLQALFLAPMFASSPPRAGRSRPLSVSLLVAAVVAAALTLALAFGVVALLSLIDEGRFPVDDIQPVVWLVLGLTLVGGWAFWTGCLLLFVRGIWADRVLGRLVGVLLAGTALEFLLLLPIDVMVRRRTDCYCATGSFFGLCLAGAAVLWLAGPGVVIVLTSRRHKAWRKTHCARCGYPMGPTPGPACPECGYSWSPRNPRPER